ncbi:hypothetical protein GO988_17235 [Hymenobacter sp. HMF4947]|uniref:Uncharacterized protein n=1 Tax=Hymenobacter ginkgonis TaxID=2682976 RepID=A0A7K1TIC7_9BACT|nr:hypothetical protein [Hymenobacter ginkgonis]MVN78076.1 hypothetical protein [Hymenobacter ginkgonis]
MKYCYFNYLVLFGLLLALGACKEEVTSVPAPIPTPVPAIDFGANDGYTGWDATRALTNPTDPTDWTTDATWNSAEMGLFAENNLDFSQPQLPASTWEVSAYPNPVVIGGKTQLSALLRDTDLAIPSSQLRILYTLVDAHYTALEYGLRDSVLKRFGVSILYPANKFSGGTLYRMYYVIYNTNNRQVYYKGHGDIKVMP